jgi:6-phosphogluconolactonase
VVVGAFAARPGPRFALVLSGGPTAKACYEQLAGTEGIDWTVVDVYVGDERVVPPDDEDANAAPHPGGPAGPRGPGGVVHAHADRGPGRRMRGRLPAHDVRLVTGPGIDLIHLGMGPDGHTASLFPGAPTLDAGPGVLALATEDPAGNNPHPRLTLTLPVINSARTAVFTVAGASKAAAVAALLRGEDLPAARVHAGHTVWLVDGPARAEAP